MTPGTSDQDRPICPAPAVGATPEEAVRAALASPCTCTHALGDHVTHRDHPDDPHPCGIDGCECKDFDPQGDDAGADRLRELAAMRAAVIEKATARLAFGDRVMVLEQTACAGGLCAQPDDVGTVLAGWPDRVVVALDIPDDEGKLAGVVLCLPRRVVEPLPAPATPAGAGDAQQETAEDAARRFARENIALKEALDGTLLVRAARQLEFALGHTSFEAVDVVAAARALADVDLTLAAENGRRQFPPDDRQLAELVIHLRDGLLGAPDVDLPGVEPDTLAGVLDLLLRGWWQ